MFLLLVSASALALSGVSALPCTCPISALPLDRNDPNCGLQYPEPCEPDLLGIVNGYAAAPGEFPWQVSLQLEDGVSPTYHFCGGSILNRRWIVTAAHCVPPYFKAKISDIRVVAGTYNIKKFDHEEPDRVRTPVEAIFPNPHYVGHNGDIALIKLAQDLHMTTCHSKPGPIGTVCLPPQTDNVDVVANQPCETTGWGATETGSTDILRKVNLTIYDHERCVKSFKNSHITKNMVCAGNGVGSIKDSCYGDSGGPLVVKMGDGRWYLYGITSWGISCGHPEYPGVYTRVTNYGNWIWQTIREHS